LPEKIVQAQIDDAVHNAIHQLDHNEDAFAEALEAQGSSREEFDKDNKENAERAVKTQLVMDAIADQLNVQVGQNDLTERLVLMSRQYGLEPQQLLQYLQENNQLPVMFADVRRGLAVAAVVHGATVTDTNGTVIDTTEFFGPATTTDPAEAAAQIAAQVEGAAGAPQDTPDTESEPVAEGASDDTK
jgi:trigger factor